MAMSLKILALTRYDQTGASSRVRFLQYIPHLERMGAHVTVKPLLPPEYLAGLYEGKSKSPGLVASAMFRRFREVIAKGDFDIIWLQREILPFVPFAIESVLLGNHKLVIDLDDAHHLYYGNKPLLAGRSILRTKIDALIKRANAVVVGNPALAAHAKSLGASRVYEIPSAVDVSRFDKGVSEPADTFEIGWIGTPVTAEQSLPLIREPLMQFISDFQAKCTLIGVGADQLLDITATRVNWSEAAEENHLPKLSVGLCPLEDTPWNRGKSGYKIIQYMAAGMPSLVSPVGIAERLVSHGETGFHCKNPDDWYAYLSQLHRDTELRATMGQNAAIIAKKKYDTASAATALHSIFETCVNG